MAKCLSGASFHGASPGVAATSRHQHRRAHARYIFWFRHITRTHAVAASVHFAAAKTRRLYATVARDICPYRVPCWLRATFMAGAV